MNAAAKWKKENPELWEKLLAATGGKCCLCRKTFSRTRLPACDHRHLDGLVRGVPCVPCNDKLGHDHEDAGWYVRAANYLDRPPALAVIGMHFVPGSLGAASPRATRAEIKGELT